MTMLDTFVGRIDELATLEAGLQRGLSGSGGIVLLAGEPGIGKSWLAETCAARATEQGAQVLWGRCYEDEGAPAYWPWMQILRSYVEATDADALRAELGDAASDVARLAPQIREKLADVPIAAPLESSEGRFFLFDAIGRFFRAAAKQRPLVMVLEDLQWADRPSLALLEFLVREVEAIPLFIVGTYRDNEVTREHPLFDTLGSLARETASERLHLDRFSEAEIARLLAGAVQRDLPEEIVATIYERTEGNPFFVRELTRLLDFDANGFGADGRGAEAAASLQRRIPAEIRETIGRRLNRLSDRCNALLAIAAVLGREFQLDALQAVSDPEERIADLLDEAAASGIISEVNEGGGYRFSHPLIRAVAYDEIGTARKIELHARAAQELERIYGTNSETHVAELAHHYRRSAAAGNAAKAAECLRQAGAHAMQSYAYESAVEHYRAAVELFERHAIANATLRVEVLVALGLALWAAAEQSESVAVFREATERAIKIGDAALVATAGRNFGISLAKASGSMDADSELPLLQRALQRVGEGDSIERSQLLARVALATHYLPAASGNVAAAVQMAGQAEEMGEEALRIARKAGDRQTLVDALLVQLQLKWRPDQLEERRALAVEINALGAANRAVRGGGDGREGAELDPLEAHGNTSLLCAAQELGELHLIPDLARPLDERARRTGRRDYLDTATLARAWLDALQGRLERARRSIEEVASHALTTFPSCRITTARACLDRIEGRSDALRELGMPALREHSAGVGSAQAVLALLTATVGEFDEARSIVQGLASDDFETIEKDQDRLPALAALAEACVALDDSEKAGVIYDLLLPYEGRNPCSMLGAFGSTYRHLGVLAAFLGRPADARQHFEDALAFNERMEALPWIAYTKADYGDLLLRQGSAEEVERAQSMLDEALATARELGMKPLEARTQALLGEAAARPRSHPDGLTAREMDVLGLVAQGRTNKEAADDLVLSVRTIERHLTNIYAKIEVRDRTEAASYARARGIAPSDVA